MASILILFLIAAIILHLNRKEDEKKKKGISHEKLNNIQLKSESKKTKVDSVNKDSFYEITCIMLGAIFPIGINFSLITIITGSIALLISIIGMFFFGVTLLFIPIIILLLFLGVANLISYFIKKKTIISNKLVSDIEDINDFSSKYFLAFKEPFVENSAIKVRPYFILGNKDKGSFIFKKGSLGKVLDLKKVITTAREIKEDELEKSSRKDTLWGDLKFILKIFSRDAFHKGKIFKKEIFKDKINIIAKGNFERVQPRELTNLYLKQASKEKKFFDFKNSESCDHKGLNKISSSNLKEINKHLEDRGHAIIILTFLLFLTLGIVGARIKHNHGLANNNTKETSDALDTCLNNRSKRFLSINNINKFLGFKRKIHTDSKSSICLTNFYSSTLDDSIRMSAVVNKNGWIESFRLTANFNYDPATNLKNLKKIKTALSDMSVNKVLESVLHAKNKDFFANNQKIHEGIITRENGYVEIIFGESHFFNRSAGEECLKMIVRGQGFGPYASDVKSLGIINNDHTQELKIYFGRIIPNANIASKILRSDVFAHEPQCKEYVQFKTLGFYNNNDEKIAGTRKDGSFWSRKR